jgi:hypothetical protein
MNLDTKTLFHFIQKRGDTHWLLRGAALFDEFEDLFGELVSSTRTALSRKQPRYSLALEIRPSLVERWPGKSKRSGATAHGLLVLVHLAKHLVLDLDQIAGIEEIVIHKQCISHGMSIQGATLSKNSLLGIVRLSIAHIYLLSGGVYCNLYYAAYRRDVKRIIKFYFVFPVY